MNNMSEKKVPKSKSVLHPECLLVGCLTSQQHASVSQGRICSDNFTCSPPRNQGTRQENVQPVRPSLWCQVDVLLFLSCITKCWAIVPLPPEKKRRKKRKEKKKKKKEEEEEESERIANALLTVQKWRLHLDFYKSMKILSYPTITSEFGAGIAQSVVCWACCPE